MPPTIACILPTYSALSWADRCLSSLERCSPFVNVVLVDDASPDWNADWLDTPWRREHVAVVNRATNQGLTPALNSGFGVVRRSATPYEFVAAINSDVLVTKDWWMPLVDVIEDGAAFVGPLTNQPGVTSRGVQDVRTWFRMITPWADVYSDPERLDYISYRLRDCYGRQHRVCDINGFFLFGRAATWRKYAYSEDSQFPPSIPVMPSGRKNPTPTMTGQEDVLNHAVHAAGGFNAVALGSYAYHARSASRDPRNKANGRWTGPVERST